ncbi:MAG: Outer membrane protein (porin) [Candidatus Kentron sp. G]|nr:MAG: Outer membrane protein (porin) [Candidatus Kentron sp. G]VFN00111.1 MAG: Outer membrane protein (porin) [Candidatus Kentron sp. G]VFN03385.1 MAG: Outer membrane protein (porin) [Candidatus Kentron sp. G]
MQKKLLSLAIAGALAVPGAAMADVTTGGSDISIYGLIHGSWDYVTTDQASGVDDNDDNTGVFRGSRIGFRGSEDLGNGFKGLFQLETQMETGNNQVQLRDTFVGVEHEKWGSVLFGRHDTPYKRVTRLMDFFVDTVADYNNIIGTHLVSNDMNNDGVADTSTVGVDVMKPAINFDERPPNLAMYSTPKFHGLQGMFARESLSNPEDDSDDEYSGFSGAVVYDQGPYYATLAYEQWEGQGVGGVVDGSDPAGSGHNGSTNRNRVDAWKLGLGYDFNGGNTKLRFIYEDIDHNQQNSSMSRDAVWAAFSHRIGANDFRIAYAAADDSEVSGANNDDGAEQLSLCIDHHLGKHTKVYFLYSHMDNDEDANYGLFKGSNTELGTDSGIGGFYSHTGANGQNLDVFSVGIVYNFM